MNMYATILGPMALGLLVGTLVSVVYFTHLETQIRKLVKRASGCMNLLFGALLRMSILMAIGWLLIVLTGVLSTVGYSLAFLLVRSVVIERARKEAGSCS